MKSERIKDMHRNDTTFDRRSFIRTAAGSVLGLGLAGFMQSCAEKEIRLTTDLAKAYIETVLDLIGKIREEELYNIRKAATFSVQARFQGNQLFSFMSGPMVTMETARTRPGSPHVFITDDSVIPSRNDVVITNDTSRSRGLGEQYVKVIGITTPRTPDSLSPLGEYANPGTFRIEDFADITIFARVPHTDAVLNVEGVDVPVCPVSGIIETLIYYALVAEITEGFTKSAIYPQVG